MSYPRLLALGALTFALALSSTAAQPVRPAYALDTIIAKPKTGASAALLTKVESGSETKVAATLPALESIRVLSIQKGNTPLDTIRKLKASGLYEYVEPDYIRYPQALPNDPKFTNGEQWNLRNTGASSGTAGADIDGPLAWDTRTDATGVPVGILDSGIRITHEDLAENLWRNPAEVAGNGIDDDNNGYADDVHGANFIDVNGDISDENGHGTSVASVIGAVSNNGKGLAGVAWKIPLVTLKWDDRSGSATISREVAAINYAIARGIKIINVSYGSDFFSQAEYDAYKKAKEAGIIAVVSAGNDSSDLSLQPSYPAALQIDNIVSVASTNRRDELSDFSNYGSGVTELAAPGEEIPVASRTGDTEYREVDGTSFSAPHVAAAMALVRAQYPNDNYRATINRVLNSVDTLTGLSGDVGTSGRLNLAKALASTDITSPNDRFTAAKVLVGDSITVRDSFAHTENEAGAPNIAGLGGAPILWYRWTPATSGRYALTTKGTVRDTTVAIFTGTTLASLAEVASNDNEAGLVTSAVSFNAVAGTAYRIGVSSRGDGDSTLAFTLGSAPANDNFADAITIPNDVNRVSGTNYFATLEASEPAPNPSGDAPSGSSVWYKWTAPTSGTFYANVYSNGRFNSVHVYEGAAISALTLRSRENKYNDPSAEFTTIAGTVYYIRIEGIDRRSGTFTLALTDATRRYYVASPADGTISFDGTTGVAAFTLNWGYIGSIVFPSSGSATAYVEEAGRSLDIHTPILNKEGHILLADDIGHVTKWSSTLDVKWERELKDASVDGSAALGADESVYARTSNGQLVALRKDGTVRWAANVPGSTYSSPSIDANGRLFVGGRDRLYCVEPTLGELVWSFETDDEIYTSPALFSDGSVCVISFSGTVYKISPTGTLVWKYTAGGVVTSSPAIRADGGVVFGCYDKKVYALKADGTLDWTYLTGDQIRASSPAIATNGNIFIGSYDGYLYQLSATGTLVKRFATGAPVRSSPMLSSYFVWWAGGDGFLYWHDVDLLVANSSWPQFRQNSRHTGRAASNAAPAFVTDPSSVSVGAGSTVSLRAQANGAEGITYQWYKDGVAISGATQADLEITNAQAANGGTYYVIATNSLGSRQSASATVTIGAAFTGGYLSNLSVLAPGISSEASLSAGFVMGGPGTVGEGRAVIRGVGPGLSTLTAATLLSDPILELNRTGAGARLLNTVDDWSNLDTSLIDTTKNVGGFALSDSSLDASLVRSFAPGSYTAVVKGHPTSTSGTALVELYDATQNRSAATPRLINLSALNRVGTNDDVLIADFTIAGSKNVTLLIRASGPGLRNVGVSSGFLADPTLTLTRQSDRVVLATNDDWAFNDATMTETSKKVGAFDWTDSRRDAAILITLPPGGYSATIRGKGSDTGLALIEVYEVY